MRARFAAKSGAVAAGTAAIVALPFVVSDFRSVELAKVGVYFIAILGLDVLTGYSGQISLGHGAGYLGMTENHWLYTLAWSIAIPLFLLAWWLLSSRFGRNVRAVRDSELAAAAFGVNRATFKVAAFGVSAAYAGVAGSLYGILSLYVSPDTFPITLSLYLLVGAVVGLQGSIWGALLGALLIEFLPDIVGEIPHVDTKQAGPTAFAFGAILVALMLLLPLALRLAAAIGRRGIP